ncbi:hypothetical protein, partial [Nocardia nova]|uniref:hypothetical protein n=1 Tax=Nocardia nova TaxID=37330 RepID=UPI001CA4E646
MMSHGEQSTDHPAAEGRETAVGAAGTPEDALAVESPAVEPEVDAATPAAAGDAQGNGTPSPIDAGADAGRADAPSVGSARVAADAEH